MGYVRIRALREFDGVVLQEFSWSGRRLWRDEDGNVWKSKELGWITPGDGRREMCYYPPRKQSWPGNIAPSFSRIGCRLRNRNEASFLRGFGQGWHRRSRGIHLTRLSCFHENQGQHLRLRAGRCLKQR